VTNYQLSAQQSNFRNFELCFVLGWGGAMHEMCVKSHSSGGQDG